MTDRPGRRGRRFRVGLAAVAVALTAAMLAPQTAGAAPGGGAAAQGQSGGDHGIDLLRFLCGRSTNNTYIKLLTCVTRQGVEDHLEAFQGFADASGGTRASGTPGYDQSADYVANKLTRAGYTVTRQEFTFPFFEEVTPAVLERTAPPPTTAIPTGTFEFSGGGDVTGTVIPVDINLVGDRASTSGCEATDFAALDFSGANDVALIQRGTCTFGEKAFNAQEAGAEAVIIFNQGNTPGRIDLIVGTLGDEFAGLITIPVVGGSFADGETLSAPGTQVHIATEVFLEFRQTENVIADSKTGDPTNVVMAGAHLDSVPAGPGINDNGSGSAALLETALQMAKVRPVNQLRFAWWGAEESGLVGSTNYVLGLSEEEAGNIALYQNYDMVGSPNYVLTVYDADESTFTAADFGVVVPPGSTAIEDVYESFYTLKHEPYDDTAFSGRSDYQAFINAGIPASGLFTGAEERKTEAQAAIWGGTVGDQFDPCYHEACDVLGNTARHALDVNADAVAFAMLTFAYSTETVNGVPGRRVPGLPIRLPTPAGPEGTFVTSGGASAPGHGDA
jgi:Zn-dependent M28 family amino/carboxypeptidase